jgi:hypothetical protein
VGQREINEWGDDGWDERLVDILQVTFDDLGDQPYVIVTRKAVHRGAGEPRRIAWERQ